MSRTATVTALDGALSRAPSPPPWLPKHGKAEWKRVLPVLVEARKIGAHELQTVEAYCVAVARIREAEEIVQREGLTFMSQSGPKRHPAGTILKDAMESARRLADALGLTPAARAKNKGGARGNDDTDDLSSI
ncbi:phage terminase small subunit P27 family [Mesorhizobium sp. M0129]|uniref:phage terminase small subunit P27 family n=2 Tax=Mesorhizobium sp. M0129 TaxID=2956886 RepID=UPI00333DFB76